MAESHFKVCPCCGNIWPTREAFLSDGSLELNGYTADFETLEEGLFFITHRRGGCGSTLAIKAREFLDLYTGPRHVERKAQSKECPRYCMEKGQLDRCTVLCECAYVREVLQILKGRFLAAAQRCQGKVASR